MTPATPTVATVFIACPGDLGEQRGVVSRALESLNQEAAFVGRVTLVPYAYENIVPARSGMDPEEVVTSYMLRPEDADLLIGMFWRRMGTPLEKAINPTTNAPYQSGTEYEYLTAYAAAQSKPLPVILLYRCTRSASAPATAEDQAQLNRVDQFFARFGPGGDLLGLNGAFETDQELEAAIRRDVATLLCGTLLPLLEQRRAARGTGPIAFGLPPLPAGYVSRPESLDELRKALLGSRAQVGVVAATALHGLGGLGKTVLARAACEDPDLRAAFPDGILWATVGQQADAAAIARIQREWVRALGGDITKVTSPEAGRSEIAAQLGERAMLLVLDDIWQESAVDALAVAAPHCRVLITTRFLTQAKGATPVRLGLMTPPECRQTLREVAGAAGGDEATLDAIAERVGSLPLALRAIGGLLAHDFTWPEIARELNAGHLEDVSKVLADTLAVSVRLLPEEAHARYQELVVFPEDVPLTLAAVTRLWQRTGNLSPFAAKRLLSDFRDRSLVLADNTLHDEYVDLLRTMVPAGQVRRLHSELCDAYAAIPDPSDPSLSDPSDPSDPSGDASPWSTLPEDDDLYAWRFIASHLSQAQRTADLQELLTDATYLEAKIARLGIAATVGDLALLSEVEPVRLIANVVRAGTVTLLEHPDEFMNQSRGREGTIPALHHPPARTLPHFALYTQSLRPADAALHTVFTGHTNAVRSCAFSPDGRYALSASNDRTLRLWEVASGGVVHSFTGHTDAVMGCAFSPDGRYALSASIDGTLRLWEVATGEEVRSFTGHTGSVHGCAFSPDGRYALSASNDRTLRLWEVATGDVVRSFTGHTSGVMGCAFSPDGRYALSASADRTLRLWEVASGGVVRSFTGHTSGVMGCAFSPDGRYALSASADRTLRLWEVASGGVVRSFTGHTDAVRSCAFSPDGRYALSASIDRTLRLWELATGDVVRSFTGHTSGVNGCAFSPDGRYALSASADRTLRLWEVATGEEVRSFTGHTSGVNGCAFSPDGRYALSASADRTLRLWEVATGEEVRSFTGHTHSVRSCAFSPDGRYALSASIDRTLRLWEVASGEALRSFTGHTDAVRSCAFSPDGRYALSASNDRTLRLWEVASGEALRSFTGHTHSVNGCAFSPDGRYALSASIDGTLRLWELATGDVVRSFTGHTDAVRSCAFSPDGRYALSASNDRTLRLWELATGDVVRSFTGHTDAVNGCAFSPDGRYALSASNDRTLRLWELASGLQKAVWYGEFDTLCCNFGTSGTGHHVSAGDSAGGMHLFVIVGLEAGAAPADLSAPSLHRVLGSAATDASVVPSATPEVSTPRRRRFWIF